MVLDWLAAEARLPWEFSARWNAAWAKSSVLLVKPATYMNHSGEAISAVANFYKIAPEGTLIVLDDFALPLGRLRLRERGGAGGHNGLDSVLAHFGTESVPRLRIGIGAAPVQGATDHVLGRFFEEEQSVLETALRRAAEAVKCTIDKGLIAAMNQFNQQTEQNEKSL